MGYAPPAMPGEGRAASVGLGGLALVLGLLTAEPAVAQTLRLRLNPQTLSFPDANPTTTPVIMGNQTIRVRVRVRNALPTDSWSVNALAGGELLSGPDVIPIANTSWTDAGDSLTPQRGRVAFSDVQIGSWMADSAVGDVPFDVYPIDFGVASLYRPLTGLRGVQASATRGVARFHRLRWAYHDHQRVFW